MAKKGFTGKALDAAYHLNAIKNIIKAFLQGGWTSAALQTLKHYWPQILAICITLIFLPTIIYCCIPMVMLGYSSSNDSQANETASLAKTVTEYFDNYDTYCQNRTDEIFNQVKSYVDAGYTVVHDGYYLSKNWFIAIFCVSVKNDLTDVTEQQIINLVNTSIIYQVETASINEEGEETTNRILVKRLSPSEVMTALEFTQEEQDWAKLIYNTLESEDTNGNSSIYTI